MEYNFPQIDDIAVMRGKGIEEGTGEVLYEDSDKLKIVSGRFWPCCLLVRGRNGMEFCPEAKSIKKIILIR